MFDEMSINPQVHYEANSDTLKGFATIGTQNNIADHALTFMVKGIKKNYKQPVTNYFTQNLNKIDKKKITGLRVVATVCDQRAVNVGAIESLIQDTKAIIHQLHKCGPGKRNHGGVSYE
ncbi:hypothetical protein ABMA28_008100 [Loxostege sticticalis]|uniref:Transposable element P transposase-like RNase H domain-containing protein n=1 Tax=Loxostege sticticalis TaxID=481309 RepID=A0ABD0SG21_LOXSC